MQRLNDKHNSTGEAYTKRAFIRFAGLERIPAKFVT